MLLSLYFAHLFPLLMAALARPLLSACGTSCFSNTQGGASTPAAVCLRYVLF